MEKYTDSETMLENTPMDLWAIQECFRYQDHLSAETKRNNNPFLVFLYLINFDDKTSYLPYDYAPSDNLPYLELQLLGKCLIAYSIAPRSVVMWLDQLLEIVDNEQLAESESL